MCFDCILVPCGNEGIDTHDNDGGKDDGSDDGGIQVIDSSDIFGEDDDGSELLTDEQFMAGIYGPDTTTTITQSRNTDVEDTMRQGVPTVIMGKIDQTGAVTTSHRSVSSTSNTTAADDNNSVSCETISTKKSQVVVDIVEKAETWAKTLLFQKCKLAGPDEFGMFGEIAEKCMEKFKVDVADARAMEYYWSSVSLPLQKCLGLRRNNVACQLSKQLKGKSFVLVKNKFAYIAVLLISSKIISFYRNNKSVWHSMELRKLAQSCQNYSIFTSVDSAMKHTHTSVTFLFVKLLERVTSSRTMKARRTLTTPSRPVTKRLHCAL